jgi:hypothetical protein
VPQIWKLDAPDDDDEERDDDDDDEDDTDDDGEEGEDEGHDGWVVAVESVRSMDGRVWGVVRSEGDREGAWLRCWSESLNLLGERRLELSGSVDAVRLLLVSEGVVLVPLLTAEIEQSSGVPMFWDGVLELSPVTSHKARWVCAGVLDAEFWYAGDADGSAYVFQGRSLAEVLRSSHVAPVAEMCSHDGALWVRHADAVVTRFEDGGVKRFDRGRPAEALDALRRLSASSRPSGWLSMLLHPGDVGALLDMSVDGVIALRCAEAIELRQWGGSM